jgi:signal transduction histidine kinase
MTRHEFKATEGLLHDVMRKQAGTLEKAVLEAVMNSVDANADEIEVHLQSDKLIVRDDGDGMTEEEVETVLDSLDTGEGEKASILEKFQNF